MPKSLAYLFRDLGVTRKKVRLPLLHSQHKEVQSGPWKMEGHWLLLGCESINLKSLEAGALSTLAGSPRQWLALRTNPASVSPLALILAGMLLRTPVPERPVLSHPFCSRLPALIQELSSSPSPCG